jgi:hypothetical protein
VPYVPGSNLVHSHGPSRVSRWPGMELPCSAQTAHSNAGESAKCSLTNSSFCKLLLNRVLSRVRGPTQEHQVLMANMERWIRHMRFFARNTLMLHIPYQFANHFSIPLSLGAARLQGLLHLQRSRFRPLLGADRDHVKGAMIAF